jgi:toxin ParE1/3/4
MKIIYSEEVFEELANLSFYLSDRSEELAQEFLNSCDDTFQFLANNKFIGSKRDFKNEKLDEVRMWRVKNFEKYLIFYIPKENGIKILHVFHSSTNYSRAFEDE